jgi:hypothetical protein
MKSRLPISKTYIKRVIGQFFPQSERAYALRRLVEVLKTVEKMRLTNGLVRDTNGCDLVRNYFVGESWIDQVEQWRKRVRVFPIRSRGAIKKPYIKYLTMMLGQIFYQSTGKKPKLAHLDQPHSDFEMFAGIFLKHYSISDCRGQLRVYMKLRKNLNL